MDERGVAHGGGSSYSELTSLTDSERGLAHG